MFEDWPVCSNIGTTSIANTKLHSYVVAIVAVVKAQKESMKKMAQKIAEMVAKQNKESTT